MKIFYSIVLTFFSFSFLQAQNIVFSMTTDISDPANIVVDIFARSTGADEGMVGYTSVFYFDATELAIVGYDNTAAATLGWNTGGNITETQTPENNPMVPSTHDTRYELQVFDGNFVGSSFSSTPIKVGTLIVDKTANGDPADGGELFLSNTMITPGIQYVDQSFTGFDIVTEGDIQLPLPIELTTFNVTKKGDEDAMVTWSTSSEQNTSHFEVERSLDNGKNWEKVGIVSANGNSTNVNNYTFDDNNLKRFIDQNQLIYYRLKSVDFDQTHQFSKTKNIEVLLDLISIAVYPNPTVDGVQVTVHSKDKAEELTAVVKDIHGKTLLIQNLGRDKMINQYVNFSELAAGTYFLSVQSEGRVFATERLVVMNK